MFLPRLRGKNDTAQPKRIASPCPAGQGAGSELYVNELPVDEVHLGIEQGPICFETGRLDASAKRFNSNFPLTLLTNEIQFDGLISSVECKVAVTSFASP